MVPTTLWDDEYYSPVSSGTGSYQTDLYIYNPPGASLTVTWQDSSGTGNFTLPAGTTRAYSAATGANHYVPQNSGVRLTGTRNFWVIGATDTEDYNLEWGFQLIPCFCTGHRVLSGVGTRYQCRSTSQQLFASVGDTG